jgi:hypothetical protein
MCSKGGLRLLVPLPEAALSETLSPLRSTPNSPWGGGSRPYRLRAAHCSAMAASFS